MTAEREILSLAALFDDRDSFVREAVMKRLMEGGESTLRELSELKISGTSVEASERIVAMERVFKREYLIQKMRDFAESDHPDLQEGLKIISMALDDVILPDYNDIVENDIIEIISEISDEKTDVENTEIFNHIFFFRFNYKFSGPEVDSLKSINIGDVIRRRRGNPIVVSILYFLYAGKSGLPISPYTFPGGFIPVFLNRKGVIQFYLNVYNFGEIFLEDNLKRFIGATGLNVEESPLKIKGNKYLTAVYAEIQRMYFSKNEGEDYKTSLLNEFISIIGKDELN